MFEGSEHASYIALCRELALEREWQPGDWYLYIPQGPHAPPDRLECVTVSDAGPMRLLEGLAHRQTIWLPLLHQLVALLDEAGESCVGFCAIETEAAHRARLAGQDYDGPTMDRYCGRVDEDGLAVNSTAPTHEEAAARWWAVLVGLLPERTRA